MKRAHRDRALNRLYADLDSGDFDVREYALFQLALMLRRANDEVSTLGDQLEGEQLPRDLLRIRLSYGDQEQIVAQLLRLISRHADSRATAFWALGEASAKAAFSQALAAIVEHGDQFSDEAAFQACRALQKWLNSEDLDTSLGDELLADNSLLRWLRRWSRSTDDRLAKCANAVIRIAKGLSD